MSYEPMMSQALYGVGEGTISLFFQMGIEDIFPVIILPHQKITQKSEETWVGGAPSYIRKMRAVL